VDFDEVQIKYFATPEVLEKYVKTIQGGKNSPKGITKFKVEHCVLLDAFQVVIIPNTSYVKIAQSMEITALFDCDATSLATPCSHTTGPWHSTNFLCVCAS
jgi:hypothetical protein